MASFAWRNYSFLLTKYPILTKASTSATLMCAADVLSQQYEIEHAKHIVSHMQTQFGLQEHQVNLQHGCVTNIPTTTTNTNQPCTATQFFNNERQLQYDATRSIHLAITGFIYSGPISHVWYNLLERLVMPFPAVPFWGLLQRLLYDAFLFSPLAVGGYFIVRSVLEGKDWPGMYAKLQAKWWSATWASWSFWPLANVFNFSFVPIPWRVLYNNGLSLFWNAYLSRLNSQRLHDVVLEQQERSMKQYSIPVHPAICHCSHCRAVRA